MGMSNLIYSKDTMVLRFSTEIQAVEIRTADFKTFSGTLYNFTKKYVPDSCQQEKEKQSKLLFNKTAINKTAARQIYETFKKLSIDTVPSQEQIERWPMFSDGISYVIEYATPSVYSFKSYGEPWGSRNELKEAAAIDDLVRELKVSLPLYTSFDSFINSLPVGTYHAGGISLITTSKESKKIRRKSR